VAPATEKPEMSGAWDGPAWGRVAVLAIANFRPESSDHRPCTLVKMVHSPDGLFGIFQVDDRYVRCCRTRFEAEVYKDSCVEFFVQPRLTSGYFNFEFNCGGAMLGSYIVDSTRIPGGFKEYTKLTPDDGRSVQIYHSLPQRVEPEIQTPTRWLLEFFIPYSLLAKYCGPLASGRGQQWRANFYKCGDQTSHPHWAAWSPVSARNFHLPDCFGTICFA